MERLLGYRGAAMQHLLVLVAVAVADPVRQELAELRARLEAQDLKLAEQARLIDQLTRLAGGRRLSSNSPVADPSMEARLILGRCTLFSSGDTIESTCPLAGGALGLVYDYITPSPPAAPPSAPPARPPQPPPSLPPPRAPPGTMRDFFIAPVSSWADAEAFCVEGGGHLVSIHSAEENLAAIAYMQAHTTSDYPWMGGTNMDSSPAWSDGSTWGTYNPGVCGTPPCDHGVDAPYMHYYRSGAWGTHVATAEQQGICARNIPVRDRARKDYFIAPVSLWPDAETYCSRNGGHLVSIHSAEENLAAIAYMQAHTTSDYPWMGGANMESSPAWSDGSTWGAYNPGTCGTPPCDHGVDAPYMHYYRSGAWGTHVATAEQQGVCAKWEARA